MARDVDEVHVEKNPEVGGEWKSARFTEKVDWAAREVSKSGPGIPNLVLAHHWLRSVLQNAAFLLLLWLLPPPESESESDWRDGLWCSFLRYTAWAHLLESLGMRHGPMFGRFGPGPLGVFANTFYRLRPGTLKLALFPRVRYIRRGILDNFCHALFFLAVGWLALAPKPHFGVRLAAGVMATSVALFDHQQWVAGNGSTYSYVLVAGCLPLSSGLACVQLHVMLVWIGCGLGKVGPWFQFVNGPFMTASLLLRGRRWFWRLAVTGEDDLRPTAAMARASSFAAHLEWAAPLLLLFPGVPALAHLGVVTLVAMHLYINFAPAAFDVYAWNFWFMGSAVVLFGGSRAPSLSLGLDWRGLIAAPSWLLLWPAFELLYLCYGLLHPEGSPNNANHRHWAGNWPNGLVFIRKGAADRLLQDCRVPGPPPWQEPPLWFQSLASKSGKGVVDGVERRVFNAIGNAWNVAMNMKAMPALAERFLAGRSTEEFHILPVLAFADLFMGGPNWNHRIPELVLAVGRHSTILPGDCVCLWAGAFPFRCGLYTGSHPWQIIDAKSGIQAQGSVSVERAISVSTLPSAGLLAEGLLWLGA